MKTRGLLTLGLVAAMAMLAVALLGCQGDVGPKGDQGSPGAAGIAGPTGPAGPEGATGPAGLAGPAGAKGATGAAGPAGPAGATGAAGPAGSPGVSTGTLSGKVTNSLTKNGVAGAAVALDPAVSGVSITTSGSGSYSATVPIGVYTLSITRASYDAASKTVVVVAGQTAASDVALKPTKAVAVNAGADATAAAGGSVALSATTEILDGSTVATYAWTQTAGASATISGGTTAKATVTLASAAVYKAQLVAGLKILDDRYAVQGINPHALEAAEAATFKVTVKTSSGTYTDTVNVTATLPYAVTTGIANVPIGVPVLLSGKLQDAGYSWSLAAPAGSTAALDSATSRNPVFTPDKAGAYTLTEANGAATVKVYAGTWTGAVTGVGADGRPDAANCTGCHNGTFAPDKFTDWRKSGHAEIFTNNVNTSSHYGESCFQCHTVGYDTSVSNGGIDDASDYAALLASDLLHTPAPGNYETALAEYPNAARLTNIQCENCHGPNTGSPLHLNGSIDAARVSLSSDVCGACHGEPLRHARYQQWEESAHGDFTLATSRGTSTSCARCHAGQGFLAWLPRLEAGNSGSLPASAITWTAAEAVPQTCATCHDPHYVGTKTGEPNDVNLRVMDNTAMLPAGFQALGVGRGALCITCHNTRNGAHNDVAFPVADDRAPHTAAQGDVLMGQNAYFVTVGQRSPHSYIADTCATCHMELSPPPAALSYNLGGTNHTFEASLAICAQCHGAFDGGTLETATHEALEVLKHEIETAIKAEIAAQIAAGNNVVLKGLGAAGADVTISDAATITALELVESHGRSAMEITVGGATYDARLASDTIVGTGTLLSSAKGQLIAKAAWNFYLIEGDGSGGIHNPSFANEVINASIGALR